jgi:hypothetical protein
LESITSTAPLTCTAPSSSTSASTTTSTYNKDKCSCYSGGCNP